MNDEVTLYSSGTLVSSATIMTGESLQSGGNDSMYVSSGGTANSTTVNSEGRLSVSSGGTATSTIVNSSGCLIVLGGGTANSIVNSGGDLYVSSGGMASHVVWTPCVGHIYADEEAVVTYASVYSGVYFGSGNTLHSSAMKISDVTFRNDGGEMYVMSGGTATRTTVNYLGSMCVSKGGTADSTTVNSCGDLRVFSGGTVNYTTINRSGSLSVSSGGTANRTTINSSGILKVSSCGTVNNTTINSSGILDVAGTANNTTVNSGGWMATNCFGGTAICTTVNSKGCLMVSWGGSAISTTVNSGGRLYGSSGCELDSTIVNFGGLMYVQYGGRVNNTCVKYGGGLYLDGIHSGELQIESGALVSAYEGAVIDFTVAKQKDASKALINNWNLISGRTDASYTITVKSDQREGVYRLAEGAGGFNSDITVKIDIGYFGEKLGTLAVGETKNFGGVAYTLSKTDDVLSFSVGAVVRVPAKSDVDGNGVSDVVFQYTGGNYQIGFWMNGTNTWQGQGVSQPDNWELLGAYDMDQNGKADIVMRGNIEGGAYIGFYKDGDVTDWQNIGYLNNSNDVDWHLAIGNLTGNTGCNSIVWHAPELGALGIWTDGSCNWVSLAGGFDSNWEMLGCGDFDGNGKDEVLFEYGGNLFTTDIDQNFASLGGWGTDWEVKAIGDFSGDGKDDLILQNGNMVVKFEDGKAENWSSVGVMDASDWFIVGAGDYNGDEADDLLVRQYSTGMLGYYVSGDMSQWVEMGRGVDMNWTVIA